MSWSKSASGTAEEVGAAIAGWVGEVESVDRTYAGEDVTQLHKAQVEKCADAAMRFLGDVLKGYRVNVSASGHGAVAAGQTTSDQWSITLGAIRLVPVPVGVGG